MHTLTLETEQDPNNMHRDEGFRMSRMWLSLLKNRQQRDDLSGYGNEGIAGRTYPDYNT